MIDFGALLYDQIYGTFGVPALLTPSDDADELAVTVTDETSGAIMNQGQFALQSIKPAVSIRARELQAAGLVPADLSGGSIILRPGTADETSWRIESYALKPSPSGETAGEVQLVLLKEDS